MNYFIESNYLWVILFLLTLLSLWTIPWKGVALWKAARKGDKIWFVILLIFNTLALLEILYIFIFVKNKNAKKLS